MKIFEEEIKRRYDERRTAKTAYWSNLLIKIILVMAVIIVIRYVSDVWDIFSSSENDRSSVEQVQ